ncbi:corticoliberin-1-like [Odontesthes bonariensis]|uniref:corticoliberin-1-like n=1 Tax=Odontesthes bonariensis TaxID=219752 RepID=UPI003F5817F6
MKLKLGLVVLLGILCSLPAEGRPADAPSHLLLHLGEELSLQLGGGGAAPELRPSSAVGALLQLTRRLLQVGAEQQEQQGGERGRRSEEPPLSLDLTFHLLREVLQMARAERLAQQADSNRRMMDTFGK